jgi:poly(3-hydroxybutyrate) depolymerase
MRLTTALLLALSPLSLAATLDDFEPRQYKDADGYTLNYRLYKPKNYDPSKPYPLILFLHGAGERGNNNTAQVRDALHWAKDSVQTEHPAFVLAPQCPATRNAFQLYGTAKDFDPSHNTYAQAAPGEWKTYRIHLAALPTGPKRFLSLINAAPVRRPGARPATPATPATTPAAARVALIPATATVAPSCEFRHVRVYEEGGGVTAPRVDLRKLDFTRRQGNGKLTVSDDGTTVSLDGDLRAKAPFAYTVTPKSILEFEFRATAQGLAHAISLDEDDFFDYRWANMDWAAKSGSAAKDPSTPTRLALAALEGLRKEFNLDPKRLYLTGLSMGGYGTWDVLARHPTLFAAAVPVCGGADESTAPAIKDLPIWCFHGGADKTVPPERSRNMIAALKAAGGNPKYTEYEGVGHNSWDKAYAEPDLPKWLFAQHRP